jgi:two-component system, OmpR family, phosphate regulon sensor histidine kinase PhoR
MIAAVVCLLAFQLYWLSNTIFENRKLLDQKVTEILSNTSDKIEKLELIYITKMRIMREQQNKILEIAKKKNIKVSSKSTTVNFISQKDGYLHLQPQKAISIDYDVPGLKNIKTNDILLLADSALKYSSDPIYVNASKNIFEKAELAKALDENLRNMKLDSLIDLSNKDSLAFKKGWLNLATGQRQFELFKDVYKDIILGKRSVFERLNPIMVDTLLKAQFKAAGLKLNYFYRVKESGKLIFASTNKPDSTVKIYKTQLFSRSSVNQGQYLELGIYRSTKHILLKMWPLFLTSFILLGFIGALFYFALDIIIKQQKLDETKNDFINNMTHELKTPVSTIALALDMHQDPELNPKGIKTEKYLNIIKHENQRLMSQIDRVLSLAKLEKGDIEIKQEFIDALQIVHQIKQNFEASLEKNLSELEIFYRPNISYTLWADKVHLTNVLFNLVDNALKYSGDKAKISISLNKSAYVLGITVTDNGPGINKEHLEHIFEKFYRIPTGNVHDVKGYGLGLSYVKNIMDLHAATISVNSEQNVGTSFILNFNI